MTDERQRALVAVRDELHARDRALFAALRHSKPEGQKLDLSNEGVASALMEMEAAYSAASALSMALDDSSPAPVSRDQFHRYWPDMAAVVEAWHPVCAKCDKAIPHKPVRLTPELVMSARWLVCCHHAAEVVVIRREDAIDGVAKLPDRVFVS